MENCGEEARPLLKPPGIPFDFSEGDEGNSLVSTTFILLNVMIGSGILIQAYVFMESGIILAILEYIIVGFMTFVSAVLMVRCGHAIGKYDYGEIANDVMGPYSYILIDSFILLSYGGALLSYVIVLGSLLQNVILTYTSSGWFTDIAFTSTILMIPSSLICLNRKLGNLAFAAYISIVAITSVVLLVLIGGPLTEVTDDASTTLNLFSFAGGMGTIGSVAFAFGYSASVLHAYTAISSPVKTLENFTYVALATTGIGVLMCFLVGLVGYLSFRASTESDILDNFTGTLGAVFKIVVIIHLIFYIPGDFVVMRCSFFNFVGLNNIDEISDFVLVGTSLFLLVFVTASAILMQIYLGSSGAFAVTLNVTGGVTQSMLSFIVPAILGIVLLQDNAFLFWSSIALLIMGIVIPILVIVSIVESY